MDRPENGIDRIRSLKQLLADEQYAKVVDLCESMQLDEELPRKFWYLKARALEGLGQKELAIEAYRSQIASLARVPPVLLGQVGMLLRDVGRLDEAVICLRESCEIEPLVERFVFLASALFRSGRSEEARDALRRGLDMNPSWDDAWSKLGAYLLDDCPKEAEMAFRRALEIDPNRVDSYSWLGQACLAQGRTEEGIQAAQEGLRRSALSGSCHTVVGQGMEALGDLEGAEAAFAKAYRCDYDKAGALLALARLSERTGRLKAAVKWYGRGLRAWPDDARIRSAFAAFVERQDQSDPEIVEMCKLHERIERTAHGQ